MANGEPQRRSQTPFKQLGGFWGGGFNLGLISGRRISLGADWWEAPVVRVGNTNTSYWEPVVICWLVGPEFPQDCLLSSSYPSSLAGAVRNPSWPWADSRTRSKNDFFDSLRCKRLSWSMCIIYLTLYMRLHVEFKFGTDMKINTVVSAQR